MINEDMEPVLIDFTFAAKYNSKRPNKIVEFNGTQPYMSPEIADGAPYYPYPAEVFSLGVLLHVLIFSRLPFESTMEYQNQTYLQFLNSIDNDSEELSLIK